MNQELGYDKSWLSDYQIRVVVEFEGLEAKITKLTYFKTSATFKCLPLIEQELLSAQLSLMLQYAGILKLRIGNFIPVNPEEIA